MPLPRKPTNLDPISGALLEYDPKTKQYSLKDMSKEKNRDRLKESLKRVRLMSKIAGDREALAELSEEQRIDPKNSDIVSDGQAAEDVLVRMGVQVGMNMGELIQVVVREGEGEDSISFNQNDLMRELVAAQKREGGLTIEESAGSQTAKFKFTTEGGCQVEYNVNMERRSKSDVAAVMGKINAESAECFQNPELKKKEAAAGKQPAPTPQPIAAETIYKFLKGQHQLLEDLLN